jgi:hypothetical protein
MRWAVALVAVLLLAGCTVPDGPGSREPTETIDTSTSAGYRRATEARGNEVNAAMQQLHAVCAKGGLADCTRALAEHEEAVAEPEELIRTTVPPPGCNALLNGYLTPLNSAQSYRAGIATALAGGDPASVTSAAARGWRGWQRAWGNNAVSMKTDPCK